MMVKLSVRIDRLLRRSRLLCRLCFGVRIPSKVIPPLWDSTSLVLRDELERSVRPRMRILEMGTGHVALLLCWLAKAYPGHDLKLVGAEINPPFVENAKRVAAINGAEIEILESNLFERVSGHFHIIFFNPPYVPSSHPAGGGRSGTLKDLTWDGGPQGTDTIEGFLSDAYRFLTDDGVILLGVNEFYVPDGKLCAIFSEKGYKVRYAVRRKRSQSRVHVLSAEGLVRLSSAV